MHSITPAAVSAGLLVSFVLLGTVGVPASSAQFGAVQNASNDTREALEVPTLDGPDTYLGEHTWLRLWSGDDDDPELSTQVGDGRFGFEASLAASTDVPFDRPLTAPARWNARNVRRHTNGGIGTSRYPEGTSVTDEGFVRDAYVAIYAVDPSTVVHTADGRTQYVGRSGRVYALSDFRVAGGVETDGGAVRHTVEEVTDTETSVVLSRDDRQLDTADGSRATLQYRDLSTSGTLRVEATVTVELRVERRACSDWSDGEETCDGEWSVSTTERTTSVTVDATRAVAINDLGASNRRRIDRLGTGNDTVLDASASQSLRPDGEHVAGVAIAPTGHWSSIAVDPNSTVGSRLRFYSRSPPGWEEFVVVDEAGTSRVESALRPLQLHAYPGPAAPEPRDDDPGTAKIDVRDVDGPQVAGPDLGADVDLAVPDRYRRPDELSFTAAVASSDLESVRIRGIVPGRSREISLPSPEPERPVTLDLRVDEINATHDRLRASVTGRWTGRPISAGHLEVGGERYPVRNGSVTATVESAPRLLGARYQPRSWLDADRIYEPSDEAVKRPTSTLNVAAVVDFALWMAMALLPLALAILGIDYATDGRLIGIVDDER